MTNETKQAIDKLLHDMANRLMILSFTIARVKDEHVYELLQRDYDELDAQFKELRTLLKGA